MFVDTHCHLDFENFDQDRDQVVERASEAGIIEIIVPAVDLANCPKVLELADQYPAVYAAVGVHPNSSSGWQDGWIEIIHEYSRHKKVVAIGEIGLDYYWDIPRDIQQRALEAQLALAADLDLPVIVHNRESSDDLINLLSKSALNGRDHIGVLHSFSADWETAAAALEMGFYIGFTGPVTFKKAEELRQIASRVPLDRILVETDAPFLAPQAYRGKRNEPAYVRFIAERIAALHNVDKLDFARQTSQNAANLFGIHLGKVEDGNE